MKPKKNPEADLRRKWVLFLQIGLILVLFLTLQAFQWKTYDSKPSENDKIMVDNLEEETPPVTMIPEVTPPPPPKAIVDKIDEVPDDEEIKEDAVAPADFDLKDLPEPDDIVEPKRPEEPIDVPFDFIEEVPLFPGCEDLDGNS